MESSSDTTYNTPEAGESVVNYTGKTRIRIFRDGVEGQTFSIKATEAVYFSVDPQSRVFAYGTNGTGLLMTGSLFVAEFATEKILFSGANEVVCDHSSFVSGNIYPYRDSDGVRSIDIFITNRYTETATS